MRKFLTSMAVASMALFGAEAWAQKKQVDVAIVGGLSDITQSHGQFFLGIRDVLENYEGAEFKVTTYSPAGGLEDEIGMDKILTDMAELNQVHLTPISSSERNHRADGNRCPRGASPAPEPCQQEVRSGHCSG